MSSRFLRRFATLSPREARLTTRPGSSWIHIWPDDGRPSSARPAVRM
jgi:hypothetical protein